MNDNPPNENASTARPEANARFRYASGADRAAVFPHLLWLTDSKLPEAVAVPPTEADWLSVIRLAYEQRMLPLLYDKIVSHLASQEWGRKRIPALRDAQLDNARRNLALAAETLRLVAVLEEAGIPTVAFKGCLLSFVAYGNLALRKGGDIDLLVQKEHVFQAVEVLAKSGYQSYEERTQARKIGHVAFDCEWELFNGQHHIGVDLHWEFSGRNYGLPAPMDRLWERLQTITFVGRKIRTFTPEDLVLMLCVHAAKHYWQRLEWAYTLARVLNQFPHLDWQKLQDAACSFHAERILALGLSIVDRTYQTPMPEALRQKLQVDREMETLIQRTMGWLYTGEGERLSIRTLRRFSSDIRPNFFAKAYYWMCAITTPTAKDYILELPKSLHGLYFLIRGVRLLGETAMHWLKTPVKAPLQPVQWIREPEIVRSVPATQASASAPASSHNRVGSPAT